ncbi:MAG: pantetheine-phosphate adenylyltransferase [bacterium]|jgi:pantetheine-phosphate adenylyltransferase
MKHSAIYPGSFDPLTLGHLDLIERASHIFQEVIVAVGVNSRKKTVFSADERIAMVKASVKGMKNVKVDAFDGLLVNYARAKDIHVLLRGLRAFSDFEYEFQMALANRKMAPEIEMIFLMPKETFSYISSSTVREISERGGDVTPFVPPPVKRFLEKKMKG